MKKIAAATGSVAVLAFAPAAMASSPSPAHVRQYVHDYNVVRHQFGASAAGCNLVTRRGSCHIRATDGGLMASLAVLDRMLAPPPVVVAAPVYHAPQGASTAGVAVAQQGAVATTASAGSGLASCILQRESNNGQTSSNVAQFQTSTWLADGGGRYAASPSAASRGQQIAVLNQALAAGKSSQWTTYDHC